MYKETYHNDELQHFGIKGMKWGVRNTSGGSSSPTRQERRTLRAEKKVRNLQRAASSSAARSKTLSKTGKDGFWDGGLSSEQAAQLRKASKTERDSSVKRQLKANKLIKKHGITSIKPTYNDPKVRAILSVSRDKKMSEAVKRNAFGADIKVKKILQIADVVTGVAIGLAPVAVAAAPAARAAGHAARNKYTRFMNNAEVKVKGQSKARPVYR